MRDRKSGAQTTMYCIGNLDTAQNSPEHPTQAHERGCTNGEGVKHKIYMSQDTVGSACEQKSRNTAAEDPPTNFLGASDALLSCWVCAVLPHFSKLPANDSASNEHTINLWQVGDGTVLGTLPKHSGLLLCLPGLLECLPSCLESCGVR